MSDILAKKNTEDAVAEHQLALSLFELGVCYMQGWGIAKNKKWGAYYYEIAADLGEPDAQNEIAHCYLNGKGVKKDKYKAAYFFQLASEQGNGYMGNAWIYKDKYLNQEPPQLNTSI
jgi:TPR repeat protein